VLRPLRNDQGDYAARKSVIPNGLPDHSLERPANRLCLLAWKNVFDTLHARWSSYCIAAARLAAVTRPWPGRAMRG
jgi:hypothetical protein